MSGLRRLEMARYKPETASRKMGPSRPGPRRNPDMRRADAPGHVEHDDQDQGIRKDERGQEQPADKKRASENR
jgi:hypothetical protein